MSFSELGTWLGPSNVTTIWISALTGALAALAGAVAGGWLSKKAAIEGARKAAELEDQREKEKEEKERQILIEFLDLELTYFKEFFNKISESMLLFDSQGKYPLLRSGEEASGVYNVIINKGYLLDIETRTSVNSALKVIMIAEKGLVALEESRNSYLEIDWNFIMAGLSDETLTEDQKYAYDMTNRIYSENLAVIANTILPDTVSSIETALLALEAEEEEEEEEC